MTDLLSRLVGDEMYSVQFVRDYVQLHFERAHAPANPTFTCDVLPTVIVDGRRFAPSEPGWADALRSLIGQEVIATQEATGVGLQIEFATGSIGLHPTMDELVGPEIAALTGFADAQWMVWRPGEDVFDDLA